MPPQDRPSPSDFLAQQQQRPSPSQFMTKTVYSGSTPVSTQQVTQDNKPLVRDQQPVNLQESPEQKFFNSFQYAPYVAGGVMGAAAGAERGLLMRSLMSALGGAGGEGGNILAQTAGSNPNAPKSTQEALQRMLVAGGLQGGIEFGAGAAMKPIQWLVRGLSPVEDPLSNSIARLSRENGLNLTAPEITGSRLGKILQKVGTSGVFGSGPATTSQSSAIDNAKRLIDQQLNLISPATSPMESGMAVQQSIRNSARNVSDVLGGQVQQTAGQLKGQQIDISPLKQWAQEELSRAGMVDRYLARQGGMAQFGNLPQTPANQGLFKTIEDQALQSGEHSTSILGKPDKTVEGVLTDLLKMPDKVDFEVANKLKQDLFSLNPTYPSAFADQATATAKTANKLLTQQMEAAVSGTPQGQAWMDARGQYRTAAQLLQKSENQPYQGQLIQQLLNSKPEDVVKHIQSVSDVNALKQAILKYGNIGKPEVALQAQQTWGQLQRQYVQGLIKTPEASGAVNEIPDLYGLKDRLNKVGDATLSSMFSNNPEALNNLRAIAEVMSRVQKVGGLNPLGVTIGLHAIAGSVVAPMAMTGHAIGALETAAAFEALPNVMSRMIYNRTGTQLFLRGIMGSMAEASQPAVAAIGKAGVGAAPYLGTGAADIVRAFQMVNASDATGQQSGGTR